MVCHPICIRFSMHFCWARWWYVSPRPHWNQAAWYAVYGRAMARPYIMPFCFCWSTISLMRKKRGCELPYWLRRSRGLWRGVVKGFFPPCQTIILDYNLPNARLFIPLKPVDNSPEKSQTPKQSTSVIINRTELYPIRLARELTKSYQGAWAVGERVH